MIGETIETTIVGALRREVERLFAAYKLRGWTVYTIAEAMADDRAKVELRHRADLGVDVIEVWNASPMLRSDMKRAGFEREELRGTQHGYKNFSYPQPTRDAGGGRVVWRLMLQPIGGSS